MTLLLTSFMVFLSDISEKNFAVKNGVKEDNFDFQSAGEAVLMRCDSSREHLI